MTKGRYGTHGGQFVPETLMNAVIELEEAYNKYKNLQIELGDVLVTLVIMAKQLDIDLEECLYLAYKKIKDRQGKTIDGVFIKEEDL